MHSLYTLSRNWFQTKALHITKVLSPVASVHQCTHSFLSRRTLKVSVKWSTLSTRRCVVYTQFLDAYRMMWQVYLQTETDVLYRPSNTSRAVPLKAGANGLPVRCFIAQETTYKVGVTLALAQKGENSMQPSHSRIRDRTLSSSTTHSALS